MGLNKFLAALAAGVLLMPAATFAQVNLSATAKQQVSDLALQLVGILTALTQAQQQGTDYTTSPAFQAQAAVWNSQVTQIAQQLISIVASAGTQTTTQTSIPTMGGSTNSCPNLTRDLSIGAQGGDVASLQLFLATDHYGQYLAGVSGYFDQATQDAVERYQSGYGVVSGGSPATTGYGRVGPGTRASIAAVCNRGSYVISVPTITVPATGNNGIVLPPPPPPPPSLPPVGYSAAQLTIVPNSLGNSGGPTSVQFSVNMQPNSSCSQAAYALSFGDGQTQNLTSNASCGNQIQVVTHVYPQQGQYTATLTSGSFSTTLVANIQAANNSLTLSAVPDSSVSLMGDITATYNPGVTCVPGSYTLSFGDGQSQTLTFNASGCIAQTQIIDHAYANTSAYLITALDTSGHAITAQFTPVAH